MQSPPYLNSSITSPPELQQLKVPSLPWTQTGGKQTPQLCLPPENFTCYVTVKDNQVCWSRVFCTQMANYCSSIAGHTDTRLQKQGLAHLRAEAAAYAGTGKLWFANPPRSEGFHTPFAKWDGLEEKQRKISRHEHTETYPQIPISRVASGSPALVLGRECSYPSYPARAKNTRHMELEPNESILIPPSTPSHSPFFLSLPAGSASTHWLRREGTSRRTFSSSSISAGLKAGIGE